MGENVKFRVSTMVFWFPNTLTQATVVLHTGPQTYQLGCSLELQQPHHFQNATNDKAGNKESIERAFLHELKVDARSNAAEYVSEALGGRKDVSNCKSSNEEIKTPLAKLPGRQRLYIDLSSNNSPQSMPYPTTIRVIKFLRNGNTK